MNDVKTEKRGLAAIYRLCPKRHCLLLAGAAVVLLHLVTRRDRALMSRLSAGVIQPLHHVLAQLNSHIPFSVAELCWGVGVIAVTVYIIYFLYRLICKPGRWRQVYITIITFLSAGVSVYALFCLMWGVYYYGDDFAQSSGLELREISAEELADVTEYFARLANSYAGRVPRDENGFCVSDREAILARSDEVFVEAEKKFPFLSGPELRAKGMYFSRIMSYTDFTGFFFPFTGEANVNTDFPPAMFASTVAHELSHQRGVAKEQEANFTAVLASLEYGDAEYCYSACLLAYTHLGNALYSADREAWERVYSLLDERIVRDFLLDSYYWQQFETPVQTVSNTVYEGFLQSYDQKLGMKSYGACVDLLVCYYLDEAREALAGLA